MSRILAPEVIDGIRCFSPDVVRSYADYPDSGFDLTDKDGEASFWVRSRNRLFKRLVLKHFALDRKTQFLEIGCGTGGFIRQLADNDNIEITGSEIYLKGLLSARRKLPDVDFVQFDVTQGVIDKKFDLVAAFDVIEHIESDRAALKNINELLHEGGSFIVSVPQHMFLWSKLDEVVKHKRRYSRRELISKLEESGFKVAKCTSFLFVLFPLMLISRVLDRYRKHSQSDEVELEKTVTFSSASNWLFDLFMRIDEVLIGMGVSLPFGGTLVIVASKPSPQGGLQA